MRKLCEWKVVKIIEIGVNLDHTYVILKITLKYSVSDFMRFLKVKSSIMIYSKMSNMWYQYINKEFWCRGYYVDRVGKNI